jgi:hypothetical protein
MREPLENNPLISALAEVRVLSQLIEAPDFVISLGTSAPKLDVPNADGPRSLWRDGALHRLWRLVWEKVRDRRIWHAFKHHPGFHRHDIDFDGTEPRLDDTRSMNGLKLSVQTNHPISKVIDEISRCAIASLFYFELESIPERHGDEYVGTGHILCLQRENDPDFKTFVNRLARSSAYFLPGQFPNVRSCGRQFISGSRWELPEACGAGCRRQVHHLSQVRKAGSMQTSAGHHIQLTSW